MTTNKKTFIRNFVPYLIRHDENKNYYILNRDYVYMGLNTGSTPPSFKTTDKYYLFNDSEKPWENDIYFIKFLTLFNKITNTLSTCLNPIDSILTVNKIIQNNSCKFTDLQIQELFMDWIRQMGIQIVNVENKILWCNDNIWQNLDTFIKKYPNRITRTINTLLLIMVKENDNWYNEKRYSLLIDYELPNFNLNILSSKIYKFISEKFFCTLFKIYLKDNNLKQLPTKTYTPLWELFNRKYHINEGVSCFEGDDGFYMFGDMYGDPRQNQNLVNFLRDTKLYMHTCFYKWSGNNENPRIHNKLLDFHRSNVWITRLPIPYYSKTSNHKKFMGLLRCAPMLMLWRKRAAEYCFHPSRMCFDIN